MEFAQYIYTSILPSALSARSAYNTSVLSVKICRKFGITGRVFTNKQQALTITEGPIDIVEHYFQSVGKDPINMKIIPHVQRLIQAREFEEYSVWLNLGRGFEFSEYIRELTPQSLQMAWPATLSPKMRIMANMYLDPAMAAQPSPIYTRVEMPLSKAAR